MNVLRSTLGATEITATGRSLDDPYSVRSADTEGKFHVLAIKPQKHKKRTKRIKEPNFWYSAEPDKGESTAWLTPHQQDPS